jgi:hypothetical protein
MKFVSTILVLLLAIPLVGCGARHVTPETSKRDLFEMKERCAESVGRVLKYSINFGDRTAAIFAHYNVTLNRCYIIQRWQPPNSASGLWTISDSQSFAHVGVVPFDKVWKAATEGDELDAVIPWSVTPIKPDSHNP